MEEELWDNAHIEMRLQTPDHNRRSQAYIAQERIP